MKIMIAVPCMDMLHLAFVQSIIPLQRPECTAVCFHPNSLIYDARNLLSLRAIQDGYDAVLWMDSDIVCNDDALMRLLDDMQETHAKMITGLYVTRCIPTYPVIYDMVREPALDKDGNMVKQIHAYENYPQESIFPVEGCGFGFVLTTTDLLKEVWDRFGPAFAPLAWTGEDIAFCHRVNKLGHQILCDSRVRLGHVGSYQYTDKLLKRGGDDNGIN